MAKGQIMKTGLTSVSFRSLSVDAVIELASRSGVDGIEWGSDVHVPETDVENARRVAHKTVDAGLSVISYGSYFYLGEGIDFTPYVDAAVAMNTKVIRIWGGKKERDEILPEEYAMLVREMRDVGALAAKRGITVALEYHGHSITATAEDAVRFIDDVGMDNVRLYWQEIIGRSLEDNLADIDLVLPYLVNVHVFNYVERKQELLGYADGPERWQKYKAKIASVTNSPAFMVEFCKGGLAESFLSDAAVLNAVVHGK